MIDYIPAKSVDGCCPRNCLFLAKAPVQLHHAVMVNLAPGRSWYAVKNMDLYLRLLGFHPSDDGSQVLNDLMELPVAVNVIVH